MSAGGAVLLGLKWGAVAMGSLLPLLYCGVFTRLGTFRFMDNRLNGEGNREMMGIMPFIHHGIPHGFQLDEIENGHLRGKVIIVTGANTGLGFSASTLLASKGATVIMACRSREKGNTAVEMVEERVRKEVGEEGGRAVGMVLDLGSFESVRGFVGEFKEGFGRLDSLMLNAGVAGVDFGKTEQGIETQIGVNHFGHFYLTHLLLPLLRQTSTPSHPTTIVSVASDRHFTPYPDGFPTTLSEINNEEKYDSMLAYGQSKLANVLFALELAEREGEGGSGVLVNVINPGVTSTDLGRNMFEKVKENWGSLGCAMESVFKGIMRTVLWDADTAALTQVYASVGPKILREKITGKYFHPIARENVPSLQYAHDKELRKAFWELSEKVVNDFENGKESD